MALKTVTGKITRPDGIVGAVSLRIVLSAPAAIAGTQEVVPAAIDVTVAPDGTWSQQLQANLDLLPATTSYTALETIGGVTAPFIFVVPQSAGPFKLADILAAAPAPSPPAALDSAVVHIANPENITGVKTFSAAPVFSTGFSVSAGQLAAIGSGDNVDFIGVNGSAWVEDVRLGTSAAPVVTGSGPALKISRYDDIPEATMPSGSGALNMGNAAIWGASRGAATTQAQVAAGVFTAVSLSTQSTHNDDACAVLAYGTVDGAGTGYGIGGYFEGRRTAATGHANGIEGRSANYTLADGVYFAAGASDTMALWLTPSGTSPSAAASVVGHLSGGTTFHVGYAAIAGSITDAFIRDDSSATTSILVNGTHTQAFASKKGAGVVSIGHVNATDALSQPTALLEVYSDVSLGASTISLVGNGNISVSYSLLNSSGAARWVTSSAGNSQLTGTVVGDTAFVVSTPGKFIHFGGTISVLKVGNDDTLGFFGAAGTGQIAGATDVLAGLVSHGLRAASANPPLDLGTGTLSAGSVVIPAASAAAVAIHESGTGATGVLIDGTHATAALAVASGVTIHGGTASIFGLTNTLLEIQANAAADADGVLTIGATSGSHNYTERIRNGSGTVLFGVTGAGGFLTGTAAGDGVLASQSTGKALHLGGTTKVISVTRANTLGFFATAPVAQQATTGTVAGFTANAGTAVQDASTFTGGTGASAYRISDIVLALKNYGLLAA